MDAAAVDAENLGDFRFIDFLSNEDSVLAFLSVKLGERAECVGEPVLDLAEHPHSLFATRVVKQVGKDLNQVDAELVTGMKHLEIGFFRNLQCRARLDGDDAAERGAFLPDFDLSQNIGRFVINDRRLRVPRGLGEDTHPSFHEKMRP